MSRYILFSPLGTTDPISNGADGAMLHICRKYLPETIFLYYSKEMYELNVKDKQENGINRFHYCIKKLGEANNHSFKIIDIFKNELVEVQKFDYFYEEFESSLSIIQDKYPEYKIILNVSSGSPAMKSALQTIAAFGKEEYLPVQVSTPEKASNPKKFDIKKFETELEWEYDKDNNENYSDRTDLSSNINLQAKIKKEILGNMIDAYDYHAAYSLGNSISNQISLDALLLLEIARNRLQLNKSGIDKILAKKKFNVLPNMHGIDRDIFEYILWLQVKKDKGEYADFLRGLTPVVVDIFELVLINKAKFDIKSYCDISKNKNSGDYKYKLKRNKLENNELGRQLLKKIDKEFENYGGFRDNSDYSSIHLFIAIETFIKNDQTLVNDAKLLREVESNARNFAAHEIVSITEEWLEKRCGLNAVRILKILKNIAEKSSEVIKSDYWDSYKNMNEMIHNELNTKVRKEKSHA